MYWWRRAAVFGVAATLSDLVRLDHVLRWWLHDDARLAGRHPGII